MQRIATAWHSHWIQRSRQTFGDTLAADPAFFWTCCLMPLWSDGHFCTVLLYGGSGVMLFGTYVVSSFATMCQRPAWAQRSLAQAALRILYVFVTTLSSEAVVYLSLGAGLRFIDVFGGRIFCSLNSGFGIGDQTGTSRSTRTSGSGSSKTSTHRGSGANR